MMLELIDVAKEYQQGDARIQVLKNLSLAVESGERVAILGPSGSGKSTLLSLLAGLDRPTTGEIRVRGQDLAQMSEEKVTQFRGAHIGIVFQQFHLLPHFTALENVALPLEISGLSQNEAHARAAQALTCVKLSHRLKHFPSQLSGGENQRVAIARALVVEPKILLADEPSGNLDSRTGEEVMDILFELVAAANTTALLVTHSEWLAKRCARQVELHEGRLVEQRAGVLHARP